MLNEIILFGIFLVLVAFFRSRRPQSLPPGPTPLPLLGNSLQIALRWRKPHLAFKELAKKHGDIFSLRLQSEEIVVLSGVDVTREFLAKRNSFSVINRALSDWRESHFKFHWSPEDGKLLRQELEEVIAVIRSQMADGRQTVIHMANFFMPSVLNLFWALVRGERVSHDDLPLQTLIQQISCLRNENTGAKSKESYWDKIFPKIDKLTRSNSNSHFIQKHNKAYQELREACKEAMKEHMALERDGHFRDFLQRGCHTNEEMIDVCLDFIMSGSEMFNSSLAFSILYLILHPEVQQKIHEEVKVIGHKNPWKIQVQNKRFPYTEAVLLEIHRLVTIVPLSLRRATTDISYRGFCIPQGTLVVANFHRLHQSEEEWRNPMEFRPSRFLDAEGKLDEGRVERLRERFNPSLLHYVVTLVRAFVWTTVPGHLDPSPAPQWDSLTSLQAPKPFNVVVTRRP